MNGEGIDYGLESGMLAADLFLDDPAHRAGALRRTRSGSASTASCAPAAGSPS
jgi:flavin-dependent dehydrogenase